MGQENDAPRGRQPEIIDIQPEAAPAVQTSARGQSQLDRRSVEPRNAVLTESAITAPVRTTLAYRPSRSSRGRATSVFSPLERGSLIDKLV